MATAGSPWPRATSRTSLSPPSPFVWCPKGSRRSSPGSCRARGRSCGGSGALNASCSSLKLHYYAGILNAVHDVLISCLPQRIIWNLHLVARKRLAVSISFFIGLVATLMGILRSRTFKVTSQIRIPSPRHSYSTLWNRFWPPSAPVFPPFHTSFAMSDWTASISSQSWSGVSTPQRNQGSTTAGTTRGIHLPKARRRMPSPNWQSDRGRWSSFLARMFFLLCCLIWCLFVSKGRETYPARSVKKRKQNKAERKSERKGYPVNNVESGFQRCRGWPMVAATGMD
ncbi:hypothetical protein BDV24DRAFT_10293 [Aspergillus arachidicola]|uniref:Rhodopsin domain-containing protein n=1 Tax=Aspergillus arachidicola TaxID=656916 RepID=A0A5N6YJ06_9EURO|nr:hypothetical protein BDV24DRAFT_10293 [Aspergillus arachidicola]